MDTSNKKLINKWIEENLQDWRDKCPNHWRIQWGGPPGECPQVSRFFHFDIKIFTKRSRAGSWRPLQEILDPLRQTATIFNC